MCRFKSAIILKDRVFVPDYDSHTDMLEELGIEDSRANAERLFIKAELSPKNGNVFSDIDNWDFVVDQDILPDWYVKEYDKKRMIEAVKEWAKNHMHIGVDDLRINDGTSHYIKDCKNVIICGNATVECICGNATVIISPYYEFKNIDKVVLSDNAILKDNYNKKIYQSGEFEFVSVSNTQEKSE